MIYTEDMKNFKEVIIMRKGRLIIFYDDAFVIESYDVELSPSGDSWKPTNPDQLISLLWEISDGWYWEIIKKDNKHIWGEVEFYGGSLYRNISFDFIIEFY